MEVLRPYQVQGAAFLAERKHALLADEPGLGKSAQAITAANTAGARKVLVLCPAVARINWLREWEKFSTRPREASAILSAKQLINGADVVVVSYDMLAGSSALRAGLRKFDPDTVILDESHFLRNRKAIRTRAVFAADGVATRAERVWALSGTPAPNHAGELWSILRFFGVTSLSYWGFIDRYTTGHDTPFGRQITGSRNIPELRKLLEPIMLRRRKTEVTKELPPITFSELVLEPGLVDTLRWFPEFDFVGGRDGNLALANALATEENYVKTMLDATGNRVDALPGLAALAGNVPKLRRYVGLQKVQPLVELLTEELAADPTMKVVIFAVHLGVITELQERLRKFGAVSLYGGTPIERRDRHINSFQNNPKCRVFVGQVIAAGTAITLTAAHQVVFAECDWVPANNAQAAMRCHRIGQTRPVTVRFASVADSIDERVQRVLTRKTRDLTKLFD
jgi:SWI/SNF-related matrix-associated actin-dependent regulator of chromatin subfamily A-like protein 1